MGDENGMDREIAIRAIQGDEEAFLQLMFAHRDALYRMALAYMKNEDAALEAVQEVTVRAYEKIGTLINPEFAKTWLIRIMMNYCRDVLHNRKRYSGNEDMMDAHGISDDLTYLEVEEALGHLSESDRQLVHMKYLHDLRIKDIAELTSVPEGTVKTRLYKAVKRLRDFFDGKGVERRA